MTSIPDRLLQVFLRGLHDNNNQASGSLLHKLRHETAGLTSDTWWIEFLRTVDDLDLAAVPWRTERRANIDTRRPVTLLAGGLYFITSTTTHECGAHCPAIDPAPAPAPAG